MLKPLIKQRLVICFFVLKRFKVKVIEIELKSIYGINTDYWMIMKKWLQHFQHEIIILFDDSRSEWFVMQDFAKEIYFMFVERLFNSSKIFCCHFAMAQVVCWRILHDNLGLWKFYLRYILSTLSSKQENERMFYSMLLQVTLKDVQQMNFKQIITRDSSWFFLIIRVTQLRQHFKKSFMKKWNRTVKSKMIEFSFFSPLTEFIILLRFLNV
jgi:hypothetical protein